MAAEKCNSCGKPQAEGEKFVFNGYVWRCNGCVKGRVMAGAIYPYTTTHFDGTPITVNSTYHLRKLEAQHGCASHAMNMDQKNW